MTDDTHSGGKNRIQDTDTVYGYSTHPWLERLGLGLLIVIVATLAISVFFRYGLDHLPSGEWSPADIRSVTTALTLGTIVTGVILPVTYAVRLAGRSRFLPLSRPRLPLLQWATATGVFMVLAVWEASKGAPVNDNIVFGLAILFMFIAPLVGVVVVAESLSRFFVRARVSVTPRKGAVALLCLLILFAAPFMATHSIASASGDPDSPSAPADSDLPINSSVLSDGYSGPYAEELAAEHPLEVKMGQPVRCGNVSWCHVSPANVSVGEYETGYSPVTVNHTAPELVLGPLTAPTEEGRQRLPGRYQFWTSHGVHWRDTVDAGVLVGDTNGTVIATVGESGSTQYLTIEGEKAHFWFDVIGEQGRVHRYIVTIEPPGMGADDE